MKWASDEHLKNVKVIHPEDGTPPYHAKFVTGMYLPLSELDEALLADLHQAKVLLDALQKSGASRSSGEDTARTFENEIRGIVHVAQAKLGAAEEVSEEHATLSAAWDEIRALIVATNAAREADAKLHR